MIEKQKLHRNETGNKTLLGYFILFFCFIMLGGIEPISANEPVPVERGAVYNLSGSQAELDNLSSNGARLAVNQMSWKKGVLGRPVRLVMADGESKPNVFAALGYDAARLLMAAVAETGSSDPGDVRRALSGIRWFQGSPRTISYPSGSRIPSKPVTISD
jgi:ABC-type branched-subunit amino acid transport system substrate-binding protein